MKEKEFYSDVKLVRIENLKGRAKEVAQRQKLTEGLALLKTSITPVPKYKIIPVEGDPLVVLKELAAEDGITEDQLIKALKVEEDVAQIGMLG